MKPGSNQAPNHLKGESSPYLQQHAYNPVDWYPWAQEAFNRARREKKPIFLSIGYSACHWCHVMEQESFEDKETAEILNRDFISIKVDREERPDIDHIYMAAVQAMTQGGGWPLTVFLTPDLEPFYGGTYFPPAERHGMPSFKRVLSGISQAWKLKRDEVSQNAKQLAEALSEIQSGLPQPGVLHLDLVNAAAQAIRRAFDPILGGLGTAPKFFHTMGFRLCLRQWKRSGDEKMLEMVNLTLDQIARGGIQDQLGGGFHRYSTDAQWLVPHFEKMLYDNALVAELFLEAYQSTKDQAFAGVARATLDYVLREMVSAEGGFFSTQDADSEGVEGRFYVWSHSEVLSILGDELGKVFCGIYDITAEGNWEGKNIPRQKHSLSFSARQLGLELGWLEDQLSVARRKLLSERSKREWPRRDEKILLSWNGLMLGALSLGFQVLQDHRYLEAAQRAARFLCDHFASPADLPSGKRRLLHSRKDGVSRLNGYLDDYAFFLYGLLNLYESDFDPQWIEVAMETADSLLDQFWDPAQQCFYFTGKDHEPLIARPREFQDGATPAGQSIAVTALLRLARLTGRSEFQDIAQSALKSSKPHLQLLPTAMAQMVIALEMGLTPSKEIVLIPAVRDEEFYETWSMVWSTFLPNRTLASPSHLGMVSPLVKPLENRFALKEQLTLYVCENSVCQPPIVGVEKIQREIQGWARR